jgi:hypothetical protein
VRKLRRCHRQQEDSKCTTFGTAVSQDMRYPGLSSQRFTDTRLARILGAESQSYRRCLSSRRSDRIVTLPLEETEALPEVASPAGRPEPMVLDELLSGSRTLETIAPSNYLSSQQLGRLAARQGH